MTKTFYNYLYLVGSIVLLVSGSYNAQAQIISTFAGNGTTGYSGDGGLATAAQIDSPTCLATDRAGNLYINDQFNHAVRRVSPSGVITTIAGNGSAGFSTDGIAATAASMTLNWGIATDTSGNLFITDQTYHRVRMVNAAGIITTIAGNGTFGFSGDGGSAVLAQMKSPLGITTDPAGNVYVGDFYNFRIRKIALDGTISTYAGNGSNGYSGDGGPAINAQLSYVFGLSTDVAGNLYICDASNNCIRKVSTDGVITTVAGNGTVGYNGDGIAATAASLSHPLGVYALPTGGLLIADYKNNRVRRVTASGIISTIAGTGDAGYTGEGMPATAARIHHPVGVIMDEEENIYVSDMLNARVRKINNVLAFVKGDTASLSICQDSGPVSINEVMAVRDIYIGLTDVWTLAQPPTHGVATVGYTTISNGGVLTPTGLSYVPDAGYTGIDSFRVRVSNSLSADYIKIYVQVVPFPSSGSISGASSVCVADTVLLASSVLGGVWSTTSGNAGIAPRTSGALLYGIAAGNDTVRYTVSNACGAVFATSPITVNPLPDPGVITGPDALCLSTTVAYVASVSGGTWSASNLNIEVLAPGSIKGTAAGTATVIYKVANDWCTATAIKTITIEVFPDPGLISGPVNVCLGSQIELTNPTAGGVWSSDFGYAVVSLGVVTGALVGNDFVNYSVTNTCGTAVATRPVAVYPVPAVPQIEDHQGWLYTTMPFATYQWRLNNFDIPGANNDSLYALQPGIYQVQVGNNEGCKSVSGTYQYNGCGPDDMVIYPSPTSGDLSITWCRAVNARLTTADGKTVGTATGVSSITFRQLPAGFYLLTVYELDGAKVKTSKIVKL